MTSAWVYSGLPLLLSSLPVLTDCPNFRFGENLNLPGTSIILQTSDDPEPALVLWGSDTLPPTVGLAPECSLTGSLLESGHLEPQKFTAIWLVSHPVWVACLEATQIWWALGGFSESALPSLFVAMTTEFPVRWPHGDTGQGQSLLLNRHWFNPTNQWTMNNSHLHLGYSDLISWHLQTNFDFKIKIN